MTGVEVRRKMVDPVLTVGSDPTAGVEDTPVDP